MVCVLGHERPVASGCLDCEPPGEVVGLAAGVDEQHRVEAGLGRERREQPLGELDERLGEIARVGRDEPCLTDDRLGHPRVAVPDHRDVVVGVEETFSVGFVDPDAFGADGVDGARICQRRQERAERLRPPPRKFRARGCAGSCAELVRNLLRSELVEQREQSPRVVVPGLDVSRVLGEAVGAPRADRDDRGEPRRHEVAEQFELELLEREAGGEPVQSDPGHSEHVLRPAVRAGTRRARPRRRPRAPCGSSRRSRGCPQPGRARRAGGCRG